MTRGWESRITPPLAPTEQWELLNSPRDLDTTRREARRDRQMANHKSALKRIRQNDKRRLRNRFHKVRMRTFIKKFRTAIDDGDVDAARENLAISVSLVHRTKSRGVIHRNAADRMVSRLNLAFNKFEAAQG